MPESLQVLFHVDVWLREGIFLREFFLLFSLMDVIMAVPEGCSSWGGLLVSYAA